MALVFDVLNVGMPRETGMQFERGIRQGAYGAGISVGESRKVQRERGEESAIVRGGRLRSLKSNLGDRGRVDLPSSE